MKDVKGSPNKSQSSKLIKFEDLKVGLYIKITKLLDDWKLPQSCLYHNYATLDSILQITGKTAYHTGSSYKPVWHPLWTAETPNDSEKGILKTVFVFPNFAEAVEITKDEYDAVYKETIAKQLAAGNLWIPSGAGHIFTIGSDPEIFVVDADDRVIPAWEFLGPEDQPNRKQNILIPFWDGFQAEFNIYPGGCNAQRVDQIQQQLAQLLQLARVKFPKAKLSSRAVMDIPPALMAEISDEHAGLGCSPSKNLYVAEPVHVENPRELPYRFAGFHIHFGCAHDSLLKERIRALDRIVGPISVSLLRGLDDSRRRAYYGRAGEYRKPKHGLEWRVLSSTALSHPILVNLMFDVARIAQSLPAGQYAHLWQVEGGDERIQHIINDYDDEDARTLLKENEPVFKGIINSLYGTSRGNTLAAKLPEKVENLILNGAMEFLDANDIERNWRLGANQQWTNHSNGENESVATIHMKGL